MSRISTNFDITPQEFTNRTDAARALDRCIWNKVRQVGRALRESEIAEIRICDDEVRFTSIYGAVFRIVDGDYRSAPINSVNFGHHDGEFRLTRRIVQELGVQTFVDVGANIGWYGINLAVEFPRAQFLALEPLTPVFQVLQDNCAINGASNISALNVAASKECGVSTMFADLEHSGRSTLSSVLARPGDTEFKCSSITLDLLASNSNWHSRVFIKIDVEGHEREVLEGSRELLSQIQPILQIELLDRSHSGGGGRATVDQLRREMRNRGYREYYADSFQESLLPVGRNYRPKDIFFVPPQFLDEFATLGLINDK